MKKLLLISVLLFSACGDVSTNKTPNEQFNTALQTVVTVEGCEYFVLKDFSRVSYEHKGNCKNPIHTSDKVTIAQEDVKEKDLVIKALQEKLNQRGEEVEDLQRQLAVNRGTIR